MENLLKRKYVKNKTVEILYYVKVRHSTTDFEYLFKSSSSY